jgi:hypothetical protein
LLRAYFSLANVCQIFEDTTYRNQAATNPDLAGIAAPMKASSVNASQREDVAETHSFYFRFSVAPETGIAIAPCARVTISS